MVVTKRELLQHYAHYFNSQRGQAYPCGNQVVVCGVITRNKDKAIEIMNKKGAVSLKCDSNKLKWRLGKEKWIWRDWDQDCRGYRFYKILLDENIDDGLFKNVVKYCSLYCCSMEVF